MDLLRRLLTAATSASATTPSGASATTPSVIVPSASATATSVTSPDSPAAPDRPTPPDRPAAATDSPATVPGCPAAPLIPFALLRREGREHLEVYAGELSTAATLAGIPLPERARTGTDPATGAGTDPAASPAAGARTLAVVPYRQIAERGFDCVDDGTPLSCLTITAAEEVPLASALALLPDTPVRLAGGGFDIDDAEYGRTVAAVLRDEIGRGEGANFVIHRTYTASVLGDPLVAALAALRRLLLGERGAYWTFLVHTGERTLVGATPERHVSVEDGLVMMNPISGTYRHRPGCGHPAGTCGRAGGVCGHPGGVCGHPGGACGHPDGACGGPDRAGLLRFLADRKEIDELYMVLDEELKMMATIAERGGQVVGPYLKEMSRLSHTEYLLVGQGSHDVREVLRQTMFAPTVTGSPIENACRVIARHERRGRGYYAGVLALLGYDEAGRQTLDAPILIRTAEIDAAGRLRVPVGATLVRHSTAAGEVAETHTKAAGVLAAFNAHLSTPDGALASTADDDLLTTTDGALPSIADDGVLCTVEGPVASPPDRFPLSTAEGEPVLRLADDPEVRAALAARNEHLARFWLEHRDPTATAVPALTGRRVLIIDAEDTFTGMLAHQLRALGLCVTLRSYQTIGALSDSDHAGPGLGQFDLVVPGPGPGDPTDVADPKMATLDRLVNGLLDAGRPILAVCLGHQVLAGRLGLPLHRREAPYQGLQREIDLFGRLRRVGFYATFTALSDMDYFSSRYGVVELARDPADGTVHALRGPGFAGVQFHPESVLTEDGLAILGDLTVPLLTAAQPAG